MADFRARILAELDDSQVPAQLRDIERRNHFNLNDIRVGNANQLISRIQDVLDHHNFNINLNGISTTNIVRQMQQAGTNAGQNFTNGFRAGMGELNTTLRNGVYEIQHMWDTLSNANFSTADINAITQDLDQLNIAVSNVVHRIDEAGNVRLTVRGVDELNRNITTVREFNRATGEIHQVSKTIGQEFDIGEEAARQFREEVNIAYASMTNLQKNILSLRKERLDLDVDADAERIRSIDEQINRFYGDYADLQNVFGNFFSPTQVANLARAIQNADNEMSRLSATSRDARNQLADTLRSNSVVDGKMDADISKLEERYRKLGVTGHSSLSDVADDLKTLRDLQSEINTSTTGNARVIQAGEEYDSILLRIKNRLSTIGNESKESMEETTSAFKRVKSILEDVASLRKEKIKLSTDPNKNKNKIASVDADIVNKLNQYKAAMHEFGSSFTSEQRSILQQIVVDARSEISRLTSEMTDTKANYVDAIRKSANNKEIASAVASVTTQYNKLGSTGHKNLDVIKTDLEKLVALQKKLENSNTGADELIVTYDKFEDVLFRIKNELSIVSSETKGFISAADVNKLDGDITLWLTKNSKAAKDYGDQLAYIQQKLKTLNVSSDDAKIQLESLRKEFISIKTSAQIAGKTGASFLSQFHNAFDRLLRYFTLAEVFREGILAIKDMYGHVVEVNSAMIELKKVTDEIDSSYDAFTKRAGDKAKEIATSISGYINSTADFARLGYDMDQAEYLAEVANIYAVVGDDINSVEDATNSIISTISAFNINVEDSIKIVDKYNEVANSFAISSGGIGDALRRSASSLAAGNNSIDESIALITAANTVVQDADVVGTALKTISMRIRGAKTELEDAGLETEGMAESTAKLREEIKALSGVDIMLDANNFKSTYQIIDELAQKWENLTDIQQASVIELIAGARQGNVVASLMENFEVARDVVTTSINSNGSAQAELERYLQGIEAKTQQFRAAYEELSITVMDADILGHFVDVGTGFISFLTDIIDTLGLFNVALASVGIGAFIKNFD